MNLQAEVKNRNREIFLKRTKIGLLYMATPLVLSFSFVDLFFCPNYAFTFFLVRLFIIPTVILSYILTRIEIVREKFYYLPISILILFMGIYHAYLAQNTGFESSAYYAGINLSLIVSIAFFPWRLKLIWLPVFLNIFPFFAVIFSDPNRKINFGVLVPNTSFILSTAFLGILSYIVTENLRKKEVKYEMELKYLNDKQLKVIELKTKEAISLERLSSQFSPQVIKAIKAGKRKLDNKRYETKICSIFVDIVSSTSKILEIDRGNFSAVIEDFVGITINTFLKYDLTIDKFYGDGVLAFSNDPIKRDDFVDRVCLAALEIKERVQRRQSFYIEHWGEELAITTGIAMGSALVGFFGDKTFIKQYSAIGTCLPLAQRLSSVAEPNDILISDRVEASLKGSGFVFETKTPVTLKGFEKHRIGIFRLLDMGASPMIDNGENEPCTSCGKNSMYIDQVNGIYVMLCRYCDSNASSENHLKKTGT